MDRLAPESRAGPDGAARLYQYAVEAWRAGRTGECLRRLYDAAAVAGPDAGLHYRLGFVFMRMQRLEEALASLEQSASLQPEQYEAHLALGRTYLDLGHHDEAQVHFQRALLAAPGLKHTDLSQVPYRSFQEEIRTAIGLTREKQWSLAQAALDAAHRAEPNADLSRLERGLEIQCGRAPREFNLPLRRPKFLYLPDLPGVPWFDRERFEWAKTVEAAAGEVRNELESLLQSGDELIPYVAEGMVSASGTDFSNLQGSLEWSAYHLNRDGWIARARRRCPRTAALMDSLPLARLRGFAPEILFSRIKAGGHIVPHFGLMNVRLTVHLGLIVPDGCTIRVANETRSWEAGRVLAFDDSFEHEAWNRSSEDRSVLIFEVWHPHLKPAEIAGLQHFMVGRRAWLDRCAP